jgi:hypothetical protein
VKSATGTLSAATGGTDYTDLAFKTIAVSGQSDVVADTAADTLTLAAGANVTITTNAGTDTVTIAATGGGGSGTVTNTGTLTSGKTIIGNGGVDVTVSSLTANLVASSSGTLAGALAAANSKLVGSGASGSGSAYSELTLGTNLSMSGTTLNAAGGSSGALTLLEQHTASSSATLDFTTFYSSTYDSYLFQFLNIVPATDGADFYMKVSTDGGSTWSASTYKYSYTYESIGGGTTGQINSGGAIAQWILAGAISSTAASAGICGELHLYNPGGSSANKVIDFNVVIAHSGGVGTFQYDGAGTWETTTAVNAVQFLFSSGNLASGTVRAYGLSK